MLWNKSFQAQILAYTWLCTTEQPAAENLAPPLEEKKIWLLMQYQTIFHEIWSVMALLPWKSSFHISTIQWSCMSLVVCSTFSNPWNWLMSNKREKLFKQYFSSLVHHGGFARPWMEKTLQEIKFQVPKSPWAPRVKSIMLFVFTGCLGQVWVDVMRIPVETLPGTQLKLLATPALCCSWQIPYFSTRDL